jgi:pyruvate decarboxylase
VSTALLSRSISTGKKESNPGKEEEALISEIISRIRTARTPVVIADGLGYQWDFGSEVNELVKATNIPATCYNAGKGLVDESLPSWIGPLTGPTELSQTTDLALIFGPLLSDTNTASWTAVPDTKACILFGLDTITVGDHVHKLKSKPLLQKLVSRLRDDESTGPTRDISTGKTTSPAFSPSPSASSIGQDAFWSRIGAWLRPNDTILLANGTPLIGGRAMHLPTPTQVIASGIWCSIGQMLPAAQGVAAAKQDLNIPGRTILFEGDGSFQVTCQALSDMIRYKLDATIFIANNAG